MKDPAFTLSYISACRALLETAEAVTAQNQGYLATFPSSLTQGLFSTESRPKKEVAQVYYPYASVLCRLAEDMDNTAVTVGTLMQQADRRVDVKATAQCDTLLVQYREFRQSLNEFLSQSEAQLQERGETVSLSRLIRYPRELHARAQLWIRFLTEELSAAPKNS